MHLERCVLTRKIESELSQVLVLFESAEKVASGSEETSGYPALPERSW